MSTSLSEVLLRVAAAIAADGGASVRAALEGVLREAAPFDAGEVVLVRGPGDPWRQSLATADGPLVGADLLAHVLAHGAAYRIDDWRDAEPFAETLGLLRSRALRSLLTVPFHFEGRGHPPLRGALAVARSHGWAFVGASLPLLGPLAGMAGLALDRALALTALEERARPVEDASLLSRVEATEARALAAEGSRDEWAQKAASLRTRSDEQDAEIQSLRGGLAGARETAASAAELAEIGHARIRDLQEQVLEREGTIRALEGDRSALASARDESDAERARLVLETARLEAERVPLEDEAAPPSGPIRPIPPKTRRGARKARG